MSEPHVLYEKIDGVAHITMNRPEVHNCFSPEMICRLADAWADVRDDNSVAVALLKGAGDAAFTSGADLQLLIPLLTRTREPESEWDERLLKRRRMLSEAMLRGFDLYKPVVAAVTGAALAGGTEILMGTDFRIASNKSIFGLTEVRRGLVPGGGSLVRLARQIPYTAAMRIILGGEPVSAEYAYRYGLVSEILPPEKVNERALEVARNVAKAGPLALRVSKEVVVKTSGLPLDEAYKIEAKLGQSVMKSKDAIEGPKAFKEKREPRFTGT